jgi:D-cysteine desulfhydrase
MGGMGAPVSIPRVALASTPTPILKLERLSARLGIELYVKRDDLTGLLESGNKIRKLEFLLGDARASAADTLITCGTQQSNCCRTVAAVSARLGLRAVLALRGRKPDAYDGNLLLDRVLGAELHFCADEQWAEVGALLEDLAARIRAGGGRPYVIPESGATVVGALGYMACGREIWEQVKAGAPDFDTIVVTAFSGGSQAGLLMGKQLTGLRAEIVSVPVAGDGAAVCEHVTEIVEQARSRYGLNVTPPKHVSTIDGYQAGGRHVIGDDTLARVAAVARDEGVILDPVYTGKAFHGLVTELERDPRQFGERVCFVHTGGIFSLFPLREPLSRLLDGQALVQ